MTVSYRTPRLGAAHPNHSAPSLGSCFGLMTPFVRLSPNYFNETDFRGETRSTATHASTSDPEARLYRKGPGMEARLAFLGHALMENRCGLLIGACLTQAERWAFVMTVRGILKARYSAALASS